MERDPVGAAGLAPAPTPPSSGFLPFIRAATVTDAALPLSHNVLYGDKYRTALCNVINGLGGFHLIMYLYAAQQTQHMVGYSSGVTSIMGGLLSSRLSKSLVKLDPASSVMALLEWSPYVLG